MALITQTPTTYNSTTRHTLSRRRGFGLGSIDTASTPNLNQLYSAQSSRFIHPALSRKTSLAALTPTSLATVPDDTEAYALSAVLERDKMPAPLTPAKSGSTDDVAVGDTVDVPGNLLGTVRFIGSVAGRKGTFAGVELLQEFAARGKNSGDVDG
jgi:hypothetical protein